MENITFKNLNKQHIAQLNSWIEKEKQLGKDGINKFIVKKEGLLGDFLRIAIEKLDDAQVYIAEKEGEIIGFLCTTLPNPKHLYIEYIGVNPEMQGKGIASKIISAFKQQEVPLIGVSKITFDVKESNLPARKAFSKIAKQNSQSANGGYISFEL